MLPKMRPSWKYVWNSNFSGVRSNAIGLKLLQVHPDLIYYYVAYLPKELVNWLWVQEPCTQIQVLSVPESSVILE